MAIKTQVLVGLSILGLACARPSGAGSYANGQLPSSALARIYHPTYAVYLRKDAAKSWNAMRAYIKKKSGVDIYPNGKISAYRTYAQQVEAKQIYGSNAATPGTSNHGLGLAVDLATQTMRSAIDRYGERFGWAKKWSDASWEWWHLKYRPGVWDGTSPVDVLKKGDHGKKVRKLQQALEAWGFDVGKVDGQFGGKTKAAVERFQRRRGLKPDGVVGPKVEKKLYPEALREGSKGPAVAALQRALNERGAKPRLDVDGGFGGGTKKAVIEFQKHRGLKPDGVVGIKVRAALGLY